MTDLLTRRLGQIMALFIVGPLAVVAFALVVVGHDVLVSFTGTENMLTNTIVSFVSAALLIGAVILLYKFVQHQGFGLFRLQR
ncbi:MAG TPA: hypothetical protein VIM84_05315 [Gemmatimonadales bacterium]